jgi:hypothetical protein
VRIQVSQRVLPIVYVSVGRLVCSSLHLLKRSQVRSRRRRQQRPGNDLSAARIGAFEPALWKGVDVVRRLIHAFYDPNFSFPKFAERFPQHRAALIDCLVGDVIKDLSDFTAALEQMTPPPPPLGSNLAVPSSSEPAAAWVSRYEI